MASEVGKQIQTGSVVGMSYVLKNESGEVLDRADAGDAFVYLHGQGQLVPGLERELEGMGVGEKKQVKVEAAEGYGEHDPELKLTVKRAQFPKEMQLEEGMHFENQNGMVFTVVSVEGEDVHVDGNHPLAGQRLHFDVEILSLRAATEDEMSHGHAHGPDGHHHH